MGAEHDEKRIIKVNISSSRIDANAPISDYFNQIHDEPLVSKKKHVPFIYALSMLVVTSLATMGITSLQSITSSITSQITSALYTFSSLPYGIGNFLVGIAALGLAVVILVWANRGREISDKIATATSVIMDDEPDEYFDLSSVDAKYMMKEFSDRGCTFEFGEDGGFIMECPNYPLTKKMKEIVSGEIEDWDKRKRIIQFVIINLIVILTIVFMRINYQNAQSTNITPQYMNVQGLSATTSQWIFIFILYFSMGLLLELRTVPSWIVGCILLPIYTIVIRFVVPDFPIVTWWALVAISISIIILDLVLYALRPYLCTERSTWWCDIL